MLRLLALSHLCALLLGGCYSFSATNLPGHIKTVTIKKVENRTSNGTMGEVLRQGIVEMFQREASSIRLVDEEGHAEFEVILVGYTNTPENFSRNADVETYKSTITVNVTFRDKVKGKDIYVGQNLRAEGVYDIAKNETEERQGQQRAIEKLQEIIVNNALARW